MSTREVIEVTAVFMADALNRAARYRSGAASDRELADKIDAAQPDGSSYADYLRSRADWRERLARDELEFLR
jgi:hypothetical protein